MKAHLSGALDINGYFPVVILDVLGIRIVLARCGVVMSNQIIRPLPASCYSYIWL